MNHAKDENKQGVGKTCQEDRQRQAETRTCVCIALGSAQNNQTETSFEKGFIGFEERLQAHQTDVA